MERRWVRSHGSAQEQRCWFESSRIHDMILTKRGKCDVVLLDYDEIATAIDAYLVTHNISVSGPRTIRWETPDESTTECAVIVDPSGKLVDNR
jgi:hypothetical protein